MKGQCSIMYIQIKPKIKTQTIPKIKQIKTAKKNNIYI